MLWYAIYRDEPQDVYRTEESSPLAAVIKRFEDAALLGMHDGRAVIGMWLIDSTTEQVVIRVHGLVDPKIRERHQKYLAMKDGTES